jgi:hypothetical protein
MADEPIQQETPTEVQAFTQARVAGFIGGIVTGLLNGLKTLVLNWKEIAIAGSLIVGGINFVKERLDVDKVARHAASKSDLNKLQEFDGVTPTTNSVATEISTGASGKPDVGNPSPTTNQPTVSETTITNKFPKLKIEEAKSALEAANHAADADFYDWTQGKPGSHQKLIIDQGLARIAETNLLRLETNQPAADAAVKP